MDDGETRGSRNVLQNDTDNSMYGASKQQGTPRKRQKKEHLTPDQEKTAEIL